MHDFWFFIHKEGFLKYFRKPSFVIIEYGQQDLNLHGLPLEPKSSVSANSTKGAGLCYCSCTETRTLYKYIDFLGCCQLKFER